MKRSYIHNYYRYMSYGHACDQCGGINEPYMLTFELWEQVAGQDALGLLCLSCVVNRLGRKLNKNDFLLEAPINHGIFGFHYKHWLSRQKKLDL